MVEFSTHRSKGHCFEPHQWQFGVSLSESLYQTNPGKGRNTTEIVDGDVKHLFKETKQKSKQYMSRELRFPTMRYVRPANAQTSLRIRAV